MTKNHEQNELNSKNFHDENDEYGSLLKMMYKFEAWAIELNAVGHLVVISTKKWNLGNDAFYVVEIKQCSWKNLHNMMIVIRHEFNYLTSCHFLSGYGKKQTFILPPSWKDDLNTAALFKM